MEDTFLHSLNMIFGFKRGNLASGRYQARLMRALGHFMLHPSVRSLAIWREKFRASRLW